MFLGRIFLREIFLRMKRFPLRMTIARLCSSLQHAGHREPPLHLPSVLSPLSTRRQIPDRVHDFGRGVGGAFLVIQRQNAAVFEFG